jgi:hypothetical protein
MDGATSTRGVGRCGASEVCHDMAVSLTWLPDRLVA